MKVKKGTLIYQPRGAAGEYAKWAVNLYNGCSNGCTYCYNRRGIQSHAFGEKPVLAAPIVKLRDKLLNEYMEEHGLSVQSSIPEDLTKDYTVRAVRMLIRKDIEKIGHSVLEDEGVFMSFKCDPFDEHIDSEVIYNIATLFLYKYIPLTILTKNTEWMSYTPWAVELVNFACGLIGVRRLLTIGFTITGCDEQEPNAPSTSERVEALTRLRYVYDIKTFVSLEPIIDLTRAEMVIESTKKHTSEIRIGCMSPLKRDRYLPIDFMMFVEYVYQQWRQGVNFYIKDSMIRQACFMPDKIKSHCLDLLIEMTGDRYVNESFESDKDD